jgi:hypothetical protein
MDTYHHEHHDSWFWQRTIRMMLNNIHQFKNRYSLWSQRVRLMSLTSHQPDTHDISWTCRYSTGRNKNWYAHIVPWTDWLFVRQHQYILSFKQYKQKQILMRPGETTVACSMCRVPLVLTVGYILKINYNWHACIDDVVRTSSTNRACINQ